MFVYLVNFIQTIQRWVYKPITHTMTMKKVDGKVIVEKSIFVQPIEREIELNNPIFKQFQIALLRPTPCKKNIEFIVRQELKQP